MYLGIILSIKFLKSKENTTIPKIINIRHKASYHFKFQIKIIQNVTDNVSF